MNEYSDNISVKSLMHHVSKTIEDRRDTSRLASALFNIRMVREARHPLFSLLECLVQQDLNRKYCLNIHSIYPLHNYQIDFKEKRNYVYDIFD